MTIKELHQNYRRIADQINETISNSARQPRDGTVWITSITPVPGRLSEAKIYDPQASGHAARCIFEGLARCSTDREIEIYTADQDRRRCDRQAGIAASNTTL